MVIRCMEKLLTEEQYKDLFNAIKEEIEILAEKLKSIKIYKILKIIGFPVISEQESEYNNKRYLENFRSSKLFSSLEPNIDSRHFCLFLILFQPCNST